MSAHKKIEGLQGILRAWFVKKGCQIGKNGNLTSLADL
jgi:hypothetical protein